MIKLRRAGIPKILAAALLAAACTDSLNPGPERGGPGAPSFDFTTTGPVTFDQRGGSLNMRGQDLHFRKGFDAANPHLGAAIVATFFWHGSTDIIQRVEDHLSNGMAVGNTYNRVAFVTSADISMATYVALNVRNFPPLYHDIDCSDGGCFDSILVVDATLSQPAAGGVMMSAYRAVDAVGVSSSASGTGNTATTAAPGPIAFAAGSAVYAVTMSNAVVQADAPAGYTPIEVMSDSLMWTDGEYALQANAGSANPQWTWRFNQPSTWLATAVPLNPAAGPSNQPPTADFTFSCSALNCSFTSTSSDPDGSIASYSWTFGDGGTSTAQNPSHSYASAGTYTVGLRVTDNQGAQSTITSKSVTVTAANQAPTANFTFTCSALSCSFTSTSSDPDGSIASYSWTFGDGGTSTAQNPSHSYATAGTYTVGLQVTDNQGAQSTITSKSVTVTAANQAPTANFTFSCSGLGCNFTSTSSDPDGTIASYTWTFGDGGTSTLQNPSHSYASAGTYTVGLRVTDNQGAQSTITSKSVTVTAPNQVPTANFTFSCSALSCNFTSTSSDPDGSIANYSWTFGDGGTSTAQNPSHTYAAGGSYTATLRVTDNRGAQSTTTSKTVTVTAPNSPPVVNAGPDQVVLLSLLGVTYTLNASFSDPNNNGPWSYTINWGDGNTSTGTAASQGTITASHHYANVLSTRTVTVTVRDASGASGSDSKVLTLVL